MLLSHNELIWRVVKTKVISRPDDTGRLVEIDFNDVNSASIDIHLGWYIMTEERPAFPGTIIDFKARESPLMQRVTMNAVDGYVLRPGEFLLAQSTEVFNLPDNISAEYKLKSSMARIGLEHLTAGWCDAGWHGSVLTLEFTNLTRYHHIRIRPGDAIGQLVFFSHELVPADRSYAARGRYNSNRTVESIKE